MYTDLFSSNKFQIHQSAMKSASWFQQQAFALNKQHLQPLKLIRAEPARNVATIVPGSLYLFAYDAKHQDTLPYWDMFPLVFPFRKLQDGFIGLNMHYLPYAMRMQLLDRLMDFKTNKMMNENTRLKYSWATIGGMSRFKLAGSCVHRYLSSQIQSPMKKIDSADWGTAMMLPVERFVGSTKNKVWTESLRK